MNIKVYDGTTKAGRDSLLADVANAVGKEQESDGIEAPPAISIIPDDDLIGIPQLVYDQISAALATKKHLMFYGPPGTGKTQLAIEVASQTAPAYALVTGSSDWTSQDLIGGYMPGNNGTIRFMPGLLLQNFDKPFIIDELNRCDIDKVLGPLFTVLSGYPSVLPYLLDPDDEHSPHFRILAEYNSKRRSYEYSPTPYWRMLATINSIDKAALYQMSYALMRRFAWVLVDVPRDLKAFVVEYCKRKNLGVGAEDASVPLAEVWSSINSVRAVGPAPIIDAITFCHARASDFDFFTTPGEAAGEIYVSALSTFVVPMLDGITLADADKIGSEAAAALGLGADSTMSRALAEALKAASI